MKVQTREGAAPPVANGMAVAPGQALAVSLSAQNGSALVWPASAASDALEVKLQARTFAAPSPSALALGLSTQEVAGARAFTLPAGDKRLHLVADSGVVAVLSQDEHVLSTHWRGDARLDDTLVSAANRLTLLPLDSAPHHATIEMLASDTPALVGDQQPWLHHFATSATERVNITAGMGARKLWVRGASAEPVFVGADGSVSRGEVIDLPSVGGVLLVEHRQGWLASWIDSARAHDPWSASDSGSPRVITASTQMKLAGAVAQLRLEATTPTIYHLRADTPAMAKVAREVTLHDASLALDVYVNGAPVAVALAPLSGTFATALEVTTTAVTPLQEGVGPEVLLGSGQTHFFSFVATQETTIGLGVRNDANALDAVLYDANAHPIARGAAQMNDVKPGTYLLSLHLPAQVPPAKVRPAIVGLVKPGSGPPENVKRKYYAGDTPEPVEFTATHVARDPAYQFGHGDDVDGSATEEDATVDEATPNAAAPGEEVPSEGEANEHGD